jgi:hypothetical protein
MDELNEMDEKRNYPLDSYVAARTKKLNLYEEKLNKVLLLMVRSIEFESFIDILRDGPEDDDIIKPMYNEMNRCLTEIYELHMETWQHDTQTPTFEKVIDVDDETLELAFTYKSDTSGRCRHCDIEIENGYEYIYVDLDISELSNEHKQQIKEYYETWE